MNNGVDVAPSLVSRQCQVYTGAHQNHLESNTADAVAKKLVRHCYILVVDDVDDVVVVLVEVLDDELVDVDVLEEEDVPAKHVGKYIYIYITNVCVLQSLPSHSIRPSVHMY